MEAVEGVGFGWLESAMVKQQLWRR